MARVGPGAVHDLMARQSCGSRVRELNKVQTVRNGQKWKGAYLIEVGHDISRQCFHRDVRFLPSLNDPNEPFCWPHKKRQANQPQSIKEKRPKVFLEVPYGAMFVVNCRA